jgi:hypothetical protein
MLASLLDLVPPTFHFCAELSPVHLPFLSLFVFRWDNLGLKVALDVALGVNYLHTRRPPLMHRWVRDSALLPQ